MSKGVNPNAVEVRKRARSITLEVYQDKARHIVERRKQLARVMKDSGV